MTYISLPQSQSKLLALNSSRASQAQYRNTLKRDSKCIQLLNITTTLIIIMEATFKHSHDLRFIILFL